MSDTSSYPEVQLHQVTRRITDGSHFSPTPREVGHLIANVKDMKSGEIDFNTCTRISQAAYRELKATGCTIKNGNVLLSKDGTVGRVVVYKQDDEIGALSSICIIDPTDQLDAAFLGQALQGEGCARQYDNFMSGSALRRLVLRDIRSIKVPLPEPEHQRSIAKVLDTLDAAIHETEAIIAKLKAVKQGLLHDLLTRGIDTNGELRPPQAEAPHLYKESPLGWIPREWGTPLLLNVSTRVTDGTHQAVTTVADGGGEVPFLFVSCVRDGEIAWDKAATITKRDYWRISKGREPAAGMVLYTAVGSYGHAAEVGDTREFAFQRHIACIYPDERYVVHGFMPLVLNWKPMQGYADRVALGNAQKTITLGELSRYPFVCPKKAEQEEIVRRMRAAQEKLNGELESLNKLRLQKFGLMDDLLTGRVRVTPLLAEDEQQPGSA